MEKEEILKKIEEEVIPKVRQLSKEFLISKFEEFSNYWGRPNSYEIGVLLSEFERGEEFAIRRGVTLLLNDFFSYII